MKTKPMIVRKLDTSQEDIDFVKENIREAFLYLSYVDKAIAVAGNTIKEMGGTIPNFKVSMKEYVEYHGPSRLRASDSLTEVRNKWLQQAVFDAKCTKLREDFNFPLSSSYKEMPLSINTDYGDLKVNKYLGESSKDECDRGKVVFRTNPEEDIKIYGVIVNYIVLCTHREKLLRYKKSLLKQQSELFEPAKRPDPESLQEDNIKMVRSYLQAGISRYNSSEHPLSAARGWTSCSAVRNLFLTKDKRKLPSAILMGGHEDTMPLAVNINNIRKLQGVIPQPQRGELVVSAGNRKALIVDAVEHTLLEAEAEAISLHEVSLAYSCTKLDHYTVQDREIMNVTRYSDTPAKLKTVYCPMDLEANRYNSKVTDQEVSSWRLGDSNLNTTNKGQIAPGIALYYLTSTKNYFDGAVRVIRDTDEIGDWDIDLTAQSYVNPRHAIPDRIDRTTIACWKAKSYPVQETRYLAKYVGDTDKTIITTGTTPKRALANIRRRIRDEIVDTLGIF